VEFYDTGVPKTYRSELSFIKNGQVVRQGSVLVNHPLSFDGLRFYQASYGVSEKSRARLTYSNAGAESPEISAGQGDTFDLPVQKAKATVLRVEENMMQFGPAVKLNIETDKRNIQFWMFQHIQDIADVNPGLFSAVPLFNPGLFKPLVFSLRGIEGKYYTGLQVVRDPGVPFVLAGGLILIAGMMVIFFIAYRRIWFLLEQDPAGVRIRVAGRSHRYNEALQRRLDDLCAWMEKELAA
jgi:cytochrome c biogenesis protein